MELFVLRHGHAEANAPADHLRRLSASGQREVVSNIFAHQSDLNQLSHVYVSPYLRAQDTYQAADGFLPDHTKIDTELLVPGADPSALTNFLYQQSEKGVKSTLLISHQPLVGTLVDNLCGLEPGAYRMGTASLAAIDLDVVAANCGSLRWLRQPV